MKRALAVLAVLAFAVAADAGTGSGTNYTTSPNMSLLSPIPGVTGALGIEPSGKSWMELQNQSFTILDGHNHAPGSGLQVPTAGILINQDLSFNGYNLTGLRSARFTPLQLSSLGAQDVGALVVSGADLYYVDAVGNQVRITASGAIAGTPGSISGLVSPAAATYTPVSKLFSWTSSSGFAANMSQGPTSVCDATLSGGKCATLQVPAGLVANYALTLPTALPGSTLPVTLSAAGQLATAQLVGNQLSPTANIVGTQLTNQTVTATQVANGTLTTTQISASAGILGSQLSATAGIVSGQLVSQAMAGRFIKRTVYVNGASGTHTTDARTGFVNVRMIGGGGGGGGVSASANPAGAGGGGSGAYAEKFIAVSPSTGYAYSVGTAGTGGSTAGGSGGAGGSSSLVIGATTITAPGGGGGTGSTGTTGVGVAAGGAGGSASSNSDAPTGGAPGSPGWAINLSGIAGPSGAYGGNGGSFWGGTGFGALVSGGGGGGGGGQGVSSGGGGGGASQTSGAAFAGGTGGMGFIIIDEYTSG